MRDEGKNRDVEGGANKRKTLQKSYKRDVENGEDLDGKRRKRGQGSVGSVNVDPDDLENERNQGGKRKPLRA